jgi:hypothetical protein
VLPLPDLAPASRQPELVMEKFGSVLVRALFT